MGESNVLSAIYIASTEDHHSQSLITSYFRENGVVGRSENDFDGMSVLGHYLEKLAMTKVL